MRMQKLPKWPTVNTDSYFNQIIFQSSSRLKSFWLNTFGLWWVILRTQYFLEKRDGNHCFRGPQLEISFKIKFNWKFYAVRDDETYIQTCVKQEFQRTFISWQFLTSFHYSPITGVKHRKQAGLDQTHQGGDTGAHDSPEGSAQGAHSHSQTNDSQAPQGAKVSMF